ncbi:glycosyltransferase [Opitutus sp. ER46]|uniref:glycosyltransferase family 2 protein n=1 Tax=Opitutus sp. ER46 TaxID=2161864 RepID=UPI000D3098A5|nr:glycosyltransferase [Opitutus sp. ER46]PTX91105.1 hypothetical protein DB354_20945 [Opitutus sp. ER46]
MKATIGIPIYNGVYHVKNLVFALRATIPPEVAEICIYDDGSPDRQAVAALPEFCEQFGVRLNRGESNLGVPGAWNRLVAAAQTEVVLLLNDDVLPTAPGWLDDVLSVFELNPSVAIAYWCQRRVSAQTGADAGLTADSRWLVNHQAGHPLLRPNFCGAFFALRKSFWSSVRQPDGSTGFWEDLRAYGEEIDLSTACHHAGRHILQLPLLWEHIGSQTFRSNPALRRREILSAFLPEEEFTASNRPPNPGWLRTQWRRLLGRDKPAVTKLEYSIAMVRKKWRSHEILGHPSDFYFSRLLQNGFPEALRSAHENRKILLPPSLSYRRGGETFATPLEELLADDTANLT